MKSPLMTACWVLFVSLALFAGLPQPLAAQSTWYATQTGQEANAGTAWDTAKDLSGALRSAVSGDTVYVAQGTYTGNFIVPAGVHVYGGWDSANPDFASRDSSKSILDGNGSVTSKRTLTLLDTAMADGFCVQNGFDTEKEDNWGGGGVLVMDGAILSNAIVKDNKSTVLGGGVACYGGTLAGLIVSGNIFEGAYIGARGAGVYLEMGDFVNSTVEKNTGAMYGHGVAAIAGSRLKNINIIKNGTDELDNVTVGGGIYLDASSADYCEINENKAGVLGGGIYAIESIVKNCTVSKNILTNNNVTLVEGGGGIYSDLSSINACRIFENAASIGPGGGVYLTRGEIYNSLIYLNTSSTDGTGIYALNMSGTASDVSIIGNCSLNENNIYIDNDAANKSTSVFNTIVNSENPVTTVGLGVVTVSHCAVKGTPLQGDGNIEFDFNTWNSSYGLTRYAKCINRGTVYLNMPDSDLNGNSRIQYGVPDIGASEAEFPGSVIVTITSPASSIAYDAQPHMVADSSFDPSGVAKLAYNHTGNQEVTLDFARNAGQYNVYAVSTSQNWEIDPSMPTGTLEITKIAATFVKSGDNTSHKFDGFPHPITVTATPAFIKEGVDFFITYTRTQDGSQSTSAPLMPGNYTAVMTISDNIIATPLTLGTIEIREQRHGVFYVKDNGNDVTNDGTSWDDAVTLGYAVRVTNLGGKNHTDTIYVAKGTYTIGDQISSEALFTMPEGVNVYGGFTELTGNTLNFATRVKGGSVLSSDMQKRVLYQADSFVNHSLWSGFKFKNGYYRCVPGWNDGGAGVSLYGNSTIDFSIISGNTTQDGSGGGIGLLCAPGSVGSSLLNSTVENNRSINMSGGGVFADSALIKNCVIQYNSATGPSADGGGADIYNSVIEDCVVFQNTAWGSGGGISAIMNSVIRNVTVYDNIADFGGGLYLSSGVKVQNATVTENVATVAAGIDAGLCEIQNSIVSGNFADYDIAGVRMVGGVMINVLVADNILESVNSGSAAVHIDNTPSSIPVSLINCTIAGNTAPNTTSAVAVVSLDTDVYITNSIIWNPDIALQTAGLFKMSHTGILGELFPGVNNLEFSADNMAASGPRFLMNAPHNYALGDGSYAINRGNNAALSGITTDLKGDSRIQVQIADIGAYESDSRGVVLIAVSSDSYIYNALDRYPSLITVDPASADTKVTFNGLETLPRNTGVYAVNVSVDSLTFYGEGTGTLQVLQGQIADWTVSADPIVYLENVGQSALTGAETFTDTYGNAVAGSLSWNTPDAVPFAGQSLQYWTFTPTDAVNYSSLTDSLLLTVLKKEVTFQFTAISKVYTMTPQAPSFTIAPASLTLESLYYRIPPVGDSILLPGMPTDVGQYYVWVSVKDDNYRGTYSTSFEITPFKVEQDSIVVADQTHYYDGTEKSISVSYTADVIGNPAKSVIYNPAEHIYVNNYEVTVMVTDPNYVGSRVDTMVILKTDITDLIVFADTTVTYTAEKQTVKITVPDDAQYDIVYTNAAGVTWDKAGPVFCDTYTVTATMNDSRYIGTKTEQMIINPCEIVFSAVTDSVVVYNAAPQQIEFKPSADILLPDSFTIRYGDDKAVSKIDAGTYKIYTTISDTNFRPNTEVMLDTELVIKPAELLVYVDSASIPYGDPVPVSFPVLYKGLMVGDSLTPVPEVATSAVQWVSPVGGYAIDFSVKGGNPNYTVEYQPDTFYVTPRILSPADLQITFPDLVYDNTEKVVVVTIPAPYSDHIEAADSKITYTYVDDGSVADIKNVTRRAYQVTVELMRNYQLDNPLVSAPFEILPKPVTLAVPQYVQAYTGTEIRYPVDSVLIATLAPNDATPEIQLSGEMGNPPSGILPGEYFIRAQLSPSVMNYSAAAVSNPAGLKIEAALITFSITDTMRTFTGDPVSASVKMIPVDDPELYQVTYTSVTTGDTFMSPAPINADTYVLDVVVTDSRFYGNVTDSFVINPFMIHADSFVITDTRQAYDGYQKFVSVDFTADVPDTSLTYTVRYEPENPVTVGDYRVFVNVTDSNHRGSVTDVLSIVRADVSALIAISDTEKFYNGHSQQIGISVPDSASYSVKYENEAGLVWDDQGPVNADTYYVTVTVDDPRYMGSAADTMFINPFLIMSDSFIVSNTVQIYDRNPHYVTVGFSPEVPPTPQISVSYTPDTPVEVGVYAVYITAVDSNYIGSRHDSLKIVQSDISNMIVVSDTSKVYNGMPQPVTVWTPDNAAYDVVYENPMLDTWAAVGPVNADHYRVIVTIVDSRYTGTASFPMVISPRPIISSNILVDNTYCEYDGTPKPVGVRLADASLPFTYADYSVTYDGGTVPQTEIGKYLVKVVLGRNFSGSKTLDQYIVRPKPVPALAEVRFEITEKTVVNRNGLTIVELAVIRDDLYIDEPLTLSLRKNSAVSPIRVEVPTTVFFDVADTRIVVPVQVFGSENFMQPVICTIGFEAMADLRYQISQDARSVRLMVTPESISPPLADIELLENTIREFLVSNGALFTINAKIGGTVDLKLNVAGFNYDELLLENVTTGAVIHPNAKGVYVCPVYAGATNFILYPDPTVLGQGVIAKAIVQIGGAYGLTSEKLTVGRHKIDFNFISNSPIAVDNDFAALVTDYVDSFIIIDLLENDIPYGNATKDALSLTSLAANDQSGVRIATSNGATVYIAGRSVVYDWSTVTDIKHLIDGYTDEFIYLVDQKDAGCAYGTVRVTVGMGATRGKIVKTEISAAGKKPKMIGYYADPYAKNAKKRMKKVSFRITDSDMNYMGILNSNIKLHNQKLLNAAYKSGLWLWQADTQVQKSMIGMEVKVKLAKTKVELPAAGLIITLPKIQKPVGGSHLNSGVDYVTDVNGNIILIVHGKNFGNKPKAYFEYKITDTGSVKKLNLPVVKSYKDADGVKITTPFGEMDEEGNGVLYLKLPAARRTTTHIYNLVISSGCGYGTMPEYPVQSVDENY